MSKYNDARDEQIDEYISLVGANSRLDLLFLSHAHADHINGVGRLLATSAGLKPDVIVLPMLEPAERLFALAMSLRFGATKSDDWEFYAGFVADPVAALAQFGPNQIIQVAPDIDGRLPGTPADPAPLPPTIEPANPNDEAPGTVGTADADWMLLIDPDADHSSETTITDNNSIYAVTSDGASHWRFVMHVDERLSRQSATFLSTFAGPKGRDPVGDLKKRIANPIEMRDIIDNQPGDLRAAYAAAIKESDHPSNTNMNVTTLSVLSTPPRNVAISDVARARPGKRPLDWVRAYSPGVAWLATGDAELKEDGARQDFLKHYEPFADHIGTMTLPHHGAVSSFHPDILDVLRPQVCVAPAAAFQNWQHPGAEVHRQVAARDMQMALVTNDPATAFVESFPCAAGHCP